MTGEPISIDFKSEANPRALAGNDSRIQRLEIVDFEDGAISIEKSDG